MSTDARLFCVFRVAGERAFSSKMELARDIERGKHIEFSTEKDGERVYMQASAIVDYVTFCTLVGVLEGDLRPFVASSNSTLQGFQHALADKVEDFASRQGFSVERVRDAVRDLISQNGVCIYFSISWHRGVC